jgi:hypothetical protein
MVGPLEAFYNFLRLGQDDSDKFCGWNKKDIKVHINTTLFDFFSLNNVSQSYTILCDQLF